MVAGSLTNAATGTINLVGTDATPISGVGAFSNAGTLNKISAGTQAISSGVFSNAGTVDVQAGTLGIVNALSQSGTMKSATGTTLELPDGFVNAAGGTLSGDGTIVVGAGTGTLVNEGTLSPATAGTVGTLTVSGNLVQGATGSVAVDLGGTGAGASDLLAVSGSIALGGTLDATLLGGYNPADGDFVPVIAVGGTANGGFALTNNPAGFTAAG